ncbi:LmbU family transcriptional regulator [Amycolatopsis lurida]
MPEFHASTPVLASTRSVARRKSPNGRPRVVVGERIITTRVGLLLPADLSIEDWTSAGRKLFRIADSSAWCLGDWLAHGQRRFTGRYQQAAEKVGLDTRTLRNYAWLARRFDHGRRRGGLSMQHHAEVASLPVAEQDRWLDLAEEHHWSRNELRRRVRGAARIAGRETGGPGDRPGTGYLPRVPVAPEELARWQEAAERMDVDLHTWVVRALNDAARRKSAETRATPVTVSTPPGQVVLNE